MPRQTDADRAAQRIQEAREAEQEAAAAEAERDEAARAAQDDTGQDEPTEQDSKGADEPTQDDTTSAPGTYGNLNEVPASGQLKVIVNGNLTLTGGISLTPSAEPQMVPDTPETRSIIAAGHMTLPEDD